ncbi:alpha-glucan family phosphorylase [Candidatus Bathycorpusculum sp.]|uniref:alpha-glucan family phosphorylase n=1 Tax=Candidatus Bathycorpusculum sp. TaxID=2994959 RepID=UPI00283772DF|nr:alpha-glucan family phosphorylase [Candidatus Termitimicrobium sp.]
MQTNELRGVLKGQKIAYFSMEIGLNSQIPTYAGGLGTLAGDAIRSSADLKLPLVAVTLISKHNYFKQKLDANGRQTEQSNEWDPEKLLTLLPNEVNVPIEGRDVKVRAWLYVYQSIIGGAVPVLFLDTDFAVNAMADREISFYLYGGDERYRLKQEAVLGFGGVRILDALGFHVRKYHMNEGHSSFLSVELMHKCSLDVEKVKELCIFTTHTPVESGHDRFSYELVRDVLGTSDLFLLKKYGGDERLNMTRLALNLSNFINGVAKRHQEISSKMFTGYEIHAITNGVHSYTWTGEQYRKLFDRYLPGWTVEPELLAKVDLIPDGEIWQAHQQQKQALIDFTNHVSNAKLDPEAFTLGFARRATEYKRATLLFSNLDRLRTIHRGTKLQAIFAGKAHPRDEGGKRLIEQIYNYAQYLKDDIDIVYLENYDMDIAAKLIGGVDVWLNTPLRPMEASGTSGMKAAHNGVMNFSVLDGWWIEGWIENRTGWAIGPHPTESLDDPECFTKELEDLYNKLEYIIIPTFYDRRDEWIQLMKNSIGRVAYYFNSHRMMRRYVTEAYI